MFARSCKHPITDRSEKLQSEIRVDRYDNCVVVPVDECLDAGVVLQIALLLNYRPCYFFEKHDVVCNIRDPSFPRPANSAPRHVRHLFTRKPS